MKIIEADVIVVGGGLSGLTAATQAAEKGASVICLEKSGTTGGAANMGMAFFAVESHVQRNQMDAWTKDEAFRFIMEYNHWKANAQAVRRWINMSADTVCWLENFGVEILGAYKYFPGSHATQHMIRMPGANRPTERQASHMVKLMTDYALSLGVQFLFRTPAKKLITGHKGQILGVLAENETGAEIKCLGDAVIVGTGGIGNNIEMIREYLGFEWGKDMFTFRIPGLDGDGIRMCWDAGGAHGDMSMEVTYNTPGTTDVFKTLSEVMRQPSSIMVNIHGERILNEQILNNTTYTGNAINRQAGRRAFTIIGSDGIEHLRKKGLDYITHHHAVKDLSRWDYEKDLYFQGAESAAENSVFMAENGAKYTEAGQSAQNFFECSSLEEVCEVTRIDVGRLKETVARYNGYAGGYDADFCKPAQWLQPITGEKYYVARHFPSGYGSLGGIKVNHRMQVLREGSETPIPGLYACGTDTANVIFGGEYCFYNPGSTMSWALNSGRMAAMEAWDYIEGDDFVE